MTIQLKFFAGLRNYLPAGQSPYPAEVAEAATVGDVLAQFGVPEDKPRILLVNGRHADVRQVLQEGDLVSVFPPVAGG